MEYCTNNYNRYEDYKKNSFAFAQNKSNTSKCNPFVTAAAVIFTVIIAMAAGLNSAPDADKADICGSSVNCAASQNDTVLFSFC